MCKSCPVKITPRASFQSVVETNSSVLTASLRSPVFHSRGLACWQCLVHLRRVGYVSIGRALNPFVAGMLAVLLLQVVSLTGSHTHLSYCHFYPGFKIWISSILMPIFECLFLSGGKKCFEGLKVSVSEQRSQLKIGTNQDLWPDYKACSVWIKSTWNLVWRLLSLSINPVILYIDNTSLK